VGKIQDFGDGLKRGGRDIDFFVKKNYVSYLKNYLKEEGFVISKRTDGGIYARKSINRKLYHLDFSVSIQLYWFPDVQFTSRYFEDIWKNRDIEKFFRYFLQFRGVSRGRLPKYSQFVKNHFGFYGKYLSDTTYFNV
jgi:hypothetical protein